MKILKTQKIIIIGIIIAGLIGGVIYFYFFRPTDSAQLLVISSVTYNPAVNNIGDIVGVFDGSHQFSENEIASFTIIRVNGITREQAEAEMNKLLPEGDKTKEDKTTHPMYKFNIPDTAKKQIDAAQLLSKIKINEK